MQEKLLYVNKVWIDFIKQRYWWETYCHLDVMEALYFNFTETKNNSPLSDINKTQDNQDDSKIAI